MSFCDPCNAIDAEPIALQQREVTIFAGRDNTIDLVLLTRRNATPLDPADPGVEWVAQSLVPVTRVTATLGSIIVDSALSPGSFSWDTQDAAGNDVLSMRLGGHFTTPMSGPLIVHIFSSDNPLGVAWINAVEPRLDVTVVA